MPLYNICAIGNALVDIIGDATDDWLRQYNVTKGAMTLVDPERAAALAAAMGKVMETSGGAAANTAVGMASLGGMAAFMGKTGLDRLGAVFAEDMRQQGVHFTPTPPTNPATPTGHCLIMVSPDAQRSMNTCLGAANDFTTADMQPELVQNAQVTYLEGYLFDPPQARDAFRLAGQIARAAGRQIAMTLSDEFCVNRHRADFLDFIRAEVDILFCNEGELQALFEVADLPAALAQASGLCKLTVTTRGAQGAIIVTKDQTVEIAAAPITQLVDTTGAGDLFAAGFLFGHTQGKDLPTCGRLAALAAGEVISHYGPRPLVKLSELI